VVISHGRVSKGKSWQVAAWKLKRRYPKYFSLKNRHEISGPDGAAINIQTQHEQMHKLSQDQAAQVAEILVDAGALDSAKLLPQPSENY